MGSAATDAAGSCLRLCAVLQLELGLRKTEKPKRQLQRLPGSRVEEEEEEEEEMETCKSCVGTGSGEALGDRNCKEEHFLYFAYGSNLLRERIMLRNPSAAFHAIANLQDYKLSFGSHQGRPSFNWHGSTATIVCSPGEEVWGIVWRMNTEDLTSLDKQEGVEAGFYSPIEVRVCTQEGRIVTCRSYQMADYVCGLPSPQYKKVICMGGKQNGLPADYQKKLEMIETNNYAGSVPLFEEIEAALKHRKKTT